MNILIVHRVKWILLSISFLLQLLLQHCYRDIKSFPKISTRKKKRKRPLILEIPRNLDFHTTYVFNWWLCTQDSKKPEGIGNCCKNGHYRLTQSEGGQHNGHFFTGRKERTVIWEWEFGVWESREEGGRVPGIRISKWIAYILCLSL